MAAPDWQRVRGLFAQALEQPTEERNLFLSCHCGADAELKREVAALVAAHARASSFLEVPQDAEEEADPLEGSRIGPYRVVRCLGRGGMGAVYLAQRDDEEFNKRVAIKVLKPGMDSGELVRRFRRERQILAALDHPYIAKLLDGGTTEQGLPYFVMENVEGEPIDRYCTRHGLDVAARLGLFQAVCAAVGFAHRNLVVHRDLKPGNILVRADGTPKLLDFGIAKLLNPELAGDSMLPTVAAAHPMTPDYASPEQQRGEHVTTASDVYSLGVLLYELLAGERPQRRHAEADLPPPSAVGGKKLGGDLDTIVMAALAREPARRYGTVEQLSEDVRRFLEGLPIAAKRSSLLYRMDKFVRRHRVGVAMAATAALALAGFALGMAVLAVRLATERDRAERERGRAEGVTEFLVSLFVSSDPLMASRPAVSAQQMLERGGQRLATDLAGEPEIRAELLRTVGTIYRHLGLPQKAEELLETALELRRRSLGEDHPKVGESLGDLASLAKDKSDFVTSRRLYEAALKVRRLHAGDDAVALARTLNDYGGLLRSTGAYDQAEAALREALAIRQRLAGAPLPEVPGTMTNLGILSYSRGRYAEAKGYFEQALELRRRIHGPDHPAIADSLGNLALVAEALGDVRGAERYARDGLAMRRKAEGPDHPRLADSLTNLGVLSTLVGACEEAAGLHEEALAIRRNLATRDHPNLATTIENLGSALECRGHLEASTERYREALAMRRRLFGDQNPAVGESLTSLGHALLRQGRLREAEPLLVEGLTLRRRLLPADHPDLAASLASLALLKALAGDGAAGESLAREAMSLLSREGAPAHWRSAAAAATLGFCLAVQGKVVEGRNLLRHSLTQLETELGERSPLSREVRLDLDAVEHLDASPTRLAVRRS